MIRRGIAVLGAAAFIAACGGGGATTAPATTRPATAAPATAAPGTAAPATSAAGLTLELATATVGDYVTGEGGMALYIFTPDAGAPGKSVCNGDCATNWPPLTVETSISEVTAGTGVTGTLGTVTRDDGSLQVTIGGAPVYYFANDAAAGDTKGQGVGDVWYLSGADGKGIGAPTAGGGRNY